MLNSATWKQQVWCLNCGSTIIDGPSKQLRRDWHIASANSYCSDFCLLQSLKTPRFRTTANCHNCRALFIMLSRHQIHCPACIKKYTHHYHDRGYVRSFYIPHSLIKPCLVCHQEVRVRNPNHIPYCRRPPCPSANFKPKGVRVIITKTYHQPGTLVSKKDACKRIICDVVDDYFNTLLNAFPNKTTSELLFALRARALHGHCGTHISRNNFAGGIFHVACNRSVMYRDIIKVIGGNKCTMEGYTKWIL
jgi:hypothetical protein